MVQKNKNIENNITIQEQIISRASRFGMVVMVAAACMNMAEMVDHGIHEAHARMHPVYAVADEQTSEDRSGQGHSDETSRAAREEVGHSHISYGAARRSPSVAGPL